MSEFIKADELEIEQSVGPFTDGDVNLSQDLQYIFLFPNNQFITF